MKLTAKRLDESLDGVAWFVLADGACLKVMDLKQGRSHKKPGYPYMVVLHIDSKPVYGRHEVPNSSLTIPTSCNDWATVKWAVRMHASLHGGGHPGFFDQI